MADLTPHQQKIVSRYYHHKDTIMSQKLSEIVSDLYVCDDAKKADRLWQSARTALAHLVDSNPRVQKIFAERNVPALAQLVNELALAPGGAPGNTPASGNKPAPENKPAPLGPDSSARASTLKEGPSEQSQGPGEIANLKSQIENSPAPANAPANPSALAPETLKSALKAFRKRMKLTRLDDESQIGSRRNPLSAGSASQIVAIQPPTQFPREVWEELVKQGKLVNEGRGFYKLAPGV